MKNTIIGGFVLNPNQNPNDTVIKIVIRTVMKFFLAEW
jgi:hypothetical protein